MFTLRELSCHKKIDLLNLYAHHIEGYIQDILFAMGESEDIAFPVNIFPAHDFHVDQQNNLVFNPHRFTRLSVDLLSFAAYYGKMGLVNTLLSLPTAGKARNTTYGTSLCFQGLKPSPTSTRILKENIDIGSFEKQQWNAICTIGMTYDSKNTVKS
ncbi:hypothetical protein BFJ69_g16569 [Fusarium oxysporum]|uniref:Uncharacterized protein n=1 Tax=Fusarium oxysporum TaxID=5507 RepID=A0A420MAS5_FUSOX|nr:hypothetical protein BFJ69_g16569 [Fusarium oxysporum]